MTANETPTTAQVSTSDLDGRTGPLDSFRYKWGDSERALSARNALADVRTAEQVKFGTAVIRTAGATAIATLNARAVEQLGAVQLVLETRVAGAIESVSAAEDRAIVSSSELCTDELIRQNELTKAGRLTNADAKYAAQRSNARHVSRLERAARRADRLVDGFDQAANEALRQSGGVES